MINGNEALVGWNWDIIGMIIGNWNIIRMIIGNWDMFKLKKQLLLEVGEQLISLHI
jgi:hypothetical protein